MPRLATRIVLPAMVGLAAFGAWAAEAAGDTLPPLERRVSIALGGPGVTVGDVVAELKDVSFACGEGALDLSGFQLVVKDVPAADVLRALGAIVPNLEVGSVGEIVTLRCRVAPTSPRAADRPPTPTDSPRIVAGGTATGAAAVTEESAELDFLDEEPTTLASVYYGLGTRALDEGGRDEEAKFWLSRALRLDAELARNAPERYREFVTKVRNRLADSDLRDGTVALDAGDEVEAAVNFRRALALAPERAKSLEPKYLEFLQSLKDE